MGTRLDYILYCGLLPCWLSHIENWDEKSRCALYVINCADPSQPLTWWSERHVVLGRDHFPTVTGGFLGEGNGLRSPKRDANNAGKLSATVMMSTAGTVHFIPTHRQRNLQVIGCEQWLHSYAIPPSFCVATHQSRPRDYNDSFYLCTAPTYWQWAPGHSHTNRLSSASCWYFYKVESWWVTNWLGQIFTEVGEK